jgi:DNA-binding response OmpR family regulator
MTDSGGHAAPVRVLVVDDESSIRLLCRINLELEGHEVREAESLDTARAELETGAIDDVLIEECHAWRPPIPVVLVTGSADVTQDRLTDADAILPKPFELDELLAAVRDLARVRAAAG